MKATRTVTVKDVAKAAGVSQAAVSMALRGSSEISAKRIEQIQAVARKLNYYPQAAGQLLRSKRKNQIGVVFAAPDSEKLGASGFQAPMLGVIASICQKNQIAYQLEMHHYRSEDPSSLPHQIAANMVDGAILIGDVGQEVYDALEQKRHFPWVSIGEPARYAVMMDICDATDQLLKQVAALGHQRVAYCDGPHRHLEHRLAFETVMRFSRAHGWDRYQLPDWFLSCESQPDLTMKKVTQWTQQLLGQSDPQMRPSLIVCHGNNISRTVAFTATEMGYKIGKDLSVTSWGSMGDARNYRPVMTSVVYDHRAMAQSALDMLMQLMQAPDAVTPQIQLIRSPICLGDSLGPCHHS